MDFVVMRIKKIFPEKFELNNFARPLLVVRVIYTAAHFNQDI